MNTLYLAAVISPFVAACTHTEAIEGEDFNHYSVELDYILDFFPSDAAEDPRVAEGMALVQFDYFFSQCRQGYKSITGDGRNFIRSICSFQQIEFAEGFDSSILRPESCEEFRAIYERNSYGSESIPCP